MSLSCLCQFLDKITIGEEQGIDYVNNWLDTQLEELAELLGLPQLQAEADSLKKKKAELEERVAELEQQYVSMDNMIQAIKQALYEGIDPEFIPFAKFNIGTVWEEKTNPDPPPDVIYEETDPILLDLTEWTALGESCLQLQSFYNLLISTFNMFKNWVYNPALQAYALLNQRISEVESGIASITSLIDQATTFKC